MHASEAFHSVCEDNYIEIEMCKTNPSFNLILLNSKDQLC